MNEVASIQVIERSAAILRACRDHGLGLSLGDIATHVSLPRSTVQRIVQSLIAENLLQSDGRSSIRLGAEALSFANAQDVDVIEVAQPFLKHLAETTGETVDLARLRRDHMVFVNQIAGSQRLRTISAVGETFPLHCTANGKASLAIMNEREWAAAKLDHLPRFSSATITTQTKLKAEIARARKAGFAVDLEEHTQGICAVGAAFRDPLNVIYAISIPVPSIRFHDDTAHFAKHLLNTVESLAAAMNLQRNAR